MRATPQHAEQLLQMIRDAQPVAAPRLLVTCEQDRKDLSAIVVERARDRKIKSADIATALLISADTFSRLMTAEHISSRRENRTEPVRLPPWLRDAVRTDSHARQLREQAREIDRRAVHVPGPLAKRLRTNAARLRVIADTHNATAQTAEALA